MGNENIWNKADWLNKLKILNRVVIITMFIGMTISDLQRGNTIMGSFLNACVCLMVYFMFSYLFVEGYRRNFTSARYLNNNQ